MFFLFFFSDYLVIDEFCIVINKWKINFRSFTESCDSESVRFMGYTVQRNTFMFNKGKFHLSNFSPVDDRRHAVGYRKPMLGKVAFPFATPAECVDKNTLHTQLFYNIQKDW